jgi:hypothetical protein
MHYISIMATTADKRLLSSPFVGSWISSARKEQPRFSKDRASREAAWAQWAVESLVEMTGSAERNYPALVLDGRFHDPKGKGPLVRPHLEIPNRVFSEELSDFPTRLALAGNALGFGWWMYHEVTALRRSLFGGAGTPINAIADLLFAERDVIAAHTVALSRMVANHWSKVESLLFEAEDGLSSIAASSFSMSEIEKVLPQASDFALRVDFDQRLVEKSGNWASRRVGVWSISGHSECDTRFSFGVLTPRLTANSQFSDDLFAIHTESPASLLIRALLFRRIIADCLELDPDASGVVIPKKAPNLEGAHLKSVPAVPGKKLPEASETSAVRFLTSFDCAEDAWEVLSKFSKDSSILLTVTEDGFEAAFRRARRFMRRAEQLDQDDINVMLPIGWDDQNRVVRVMFAQNRK